MNINDKNKVKLGNEVIQEFIKEFDKSLNPKSIEFFYLILELLHDKKFSKFSQKL